MRIIEVRIKLADEASAGAGIIRAYATIKITGEPLGSVVVKEIRVLEEQDGRVFVAMPSRKATGWCNDCGGKNPAWAKFCAWCGVPQPADGPRQEKYHVDLFHATDGPTRRRIEAAVLDEYHRALGSKLPDSGKTQGG